MRPQHLNQYTNKVFIFFRYNIYRDGYDIRNSVFGQYSVNMGYPTTTIHVKNTFDSSTTKQE